MEKNIFENAYFGKSYKTRDGKKAIYINNLSDYTYHHQLALCNGDIEVYDNFGTRSYGGNGLDIVSEWQEEPITEEELDKLAEQLNPNNPHTETYTIGLYSGYNDGFKDCYHYLENKNKEK